MGLNADRALHKPHSRRMSYVTGLRRAELRGREAAGHMVSNPYTRWDFRKCWDDGYLRGLKEQEQHSK